MIIIKIYGYCRVSDVSQNENRQIDEMIKLAIPKNQIYLDKVCDTIL
jgi:DNA invertase Pin-like site-specific DNA recombinase